MTQFTRILTILACTFALSMTIGCGKDGKSGSGDEAGSDDPAAQLAAIAEKACACEDIECAMAAKKEFGALEKELQKEYPKEEDVPKDVMKAYEEAHKKGRKCAKELRKKARASGKSGASK